MSSPWCAPGPLLHAALLPSLAVRLVGSSSTSRQFKTRYRADVRLLFEAVDQRLFLDIVGDLSAMALLFHYGHAPAEKTFFPTLDVRTRRLR